MSTKLIVHKFESEFSYKTLHIPIDEPGKRSRKCNENSVEEPESASRQGKRNPGGGKSRLVVKLATPNDISQINLDLCAKKLNRTLDSENDIKLLASKYLLAYNPNNNNNSIRVNNAENIEVVNDTFCKVINKNVPSSHPSPLEYSLKRVKENNARIMENIKMLNRTLNYTKNIDPNNYPKASKSFACTECGKCFVYETGLKRHYAMQHSISEPAPNWQTVWTCTECYQVWPRRDIAERHAERQCRNGHKDRIREIKTSSLLQCEFCEKIYTSIPRLIRHSKSHTSLRNYECNACDIAFPSYRDFENHWSTCPWQEDFYNFALLKLLLCNTCDRKFKTYEQLYNHRYKVGHFMAKVNGNDIPSIGTLMYQCELCAQCLPSAQTLLVHRGQYHLQPSVPYQNPPFGTQED